MTKKQFIENSSYPDVAKAVINQCGGWSEFQDLAADVANHGADSGFSGFIYYSDTCAFAKKNRNAIIAMAEAQASELGLSGALELIASFNCLNGDYSQSEIAQAIYDNDDDQQVLNALAWYALEEVSRQFEYLQAA